MRLESTVMTCTALCSVQVSTTASAWIWHVQSCHTQNGCEKNSDSFQEVTGGLFPSADLQVPGDSCSDVQLQFQDGDLVGMCLGAEAQWALLMVLRYRSSWAGCVLPDPFSRPFLFNALGTLLKCKISYECCFCFVLAFRMPVIFRGFSMQGAILPVDF